MLTVIFHKKSAISAIYKYYEVFTKCYINAQRFFIQARWELELMEPLVRQCYERVSDNGISGDNTAN